MGIFTIEDEVSMDIRRTLKREHIFLQLSVREEPA